MLSDPSGFTVEEREQSRRFHRPRHAVLLADLAVAVVVLAALTQLAWPLPWWAAVVVVPAAVELIVAAARLPAGVWRHRQERRYRLSTQSPRAYALDVAKALAVGAVLTVATLAPLFVLARLWPHGWPWPAAVGAAVLVLLLGLVAPLVLEPIFNRFRPLGDPELAARLRALADAAGAPVREILVADASRRTTRRNAYVSGLGRTRRVVVWDTLLADPADELAVVVAHELAHRARRHVAWLTLTGMAGAAAFVVLLRLVVPRPEPDDTALILLLALVCELAALPFVSALSRRFERTADRVSIDLTGDRPAYGRLHRRLALVNLTELEPPLWLYFWLHSHPTPPQRLQSP